MGLTISSRLAQLMGGQLSVVSAQGTGSTFQFTLPCSIVTGERKLPVCDEMQLRNAPILVVDDNAINRQILREMLAKWRVDCTLAENGTEALRLIRSSVQAGQPFALILLDAQMPGMDGFSVVHSIKGIEEYTGVPIMMLSSSDLNTDAAYCRRLGIDTYLVKPVCESELRLAVLSALAGRKTNGLPPVKMDTALPQSAAGKRILLAEDNPVNQRLASRLLQKQGHSVEIASTGLEAVKKSAAQNFDVILMDVQMPEMDGLQATEAIRERERSTGKHIPILAVTAHAMTGDRERCLASGMDGYLSKPIRAQDVFDALSSIQYVPVPLTLTGS